ncbi:unnamed protein product [Hydatigera taeniaeformis]|uniref:Exostosin domain-containing protein n=1 Tax=Hydatigena taeniaeformis TaxID=6205 RepID=A0A0R3X076_HYDTA|nr:unnamed protein product [Hydatigera taeniaeformis]
MAQSADFCHRGLPVNPLILLPSGWVYSAEWESLCPTEETLFDLLDNQCFSAALHFAINHPSSPFIDPLRRPRAVSWFNLEVNPALKNDVVAIVIPIVGWKRNDILQLMETCDKNANVESDWYNTCYVEIHRCIQSWRLTQLLNLRVAVALPWPDLIPYFGKQNPSQSESSFIDLRCFARRGIAVSFIKGNVTILPNLFEEATRELLLTLLILTIKGYGRETETNFINGTRIMRYFASVVFTIHLVHKPPSVQLMPSIPHRSCIEGVDFDPNMPTFLHNSDVVIIMDDCSDRRASLSKALRSRSPIRQKSTKRSRYSIQEEDFRYFKNTGIFISTCPVENFSFSTLAMALRNQTLSGAAFTIPMDGSLSSDELQSLYYMKNVLAVPPPSTAGFAPKLLRRQLAGLVLQSISEGLGLPYLGFSELVPPSDLKRTFSYSGSNKPKSRGVPNLTGKFWSALRSGRSGRECREDRSQSLSAR